MQNAECKVQNDNASRHIIAEKSFEFAVRIVNLSKYLMQEHKEYVLSKQLLRCGTSIGANIAEAKHAQSRADFISKMNIALKEVAEADFWLRLLHETGYLDDIQFASIMRDCDELECLLVSIVKTTKTNS